ncbi:MAG: hypothetical protein H0W75_00700 [Chitinophagaceae bacterium]|nr:hypothetical protein [Chitinophagaceae bacterium]
MLLDKTQIELLKSIQGKLRRGDKTLIAKKTKFTPMYVWMVLNPDHEYYNEIIVAEAVKIISNREQNRQKLLKSIAAA